MTTMAFIVLTPEQAEAAELLNGDGVALGARSINSPLADNLGLGSLIGMRVAAARLLNDPDYQRWVPALGTCPIHVMDSDTLFLPEVA